MGKRNKWELGRKVTLDPELMDSVAFHELSAAGIHVLLRFLRKRPFVYQGRHKPPIFTDTGLMFTYAEAKALKLCNSSQFFKILKKLVEVGFLDPEHQGGAYAKDSSTYAYSERWKQYGTKEFIVVEKKRSLRGPTIQENLKHKNKILLHKTIVDNYANA